MNYILYFTEYQNNIKTRAIIPEEKESEFSQLLKRNVFFCPFQKSGGVSELFDFLHSFSLYIFMVSSKKHSNHRHL